MLLQDWLWADKQFRLTEEIGGPYPFCGFGCCAEVQRWSQKRKDVKFNEIEFLFEDGDEHRGELRTLCEAQLGISVVFAGKERKPFEVGDLIAGLNRRSILEVVTQGKAAKRPYLDELRKAGSAIKYFSRPELIQLCEEAHISKRETRSVAS